MISIAYSFIKAIIIFIVFRVACTHLSTRITSFRLGCKSPPTFPILSSIALFLNNQKLFKLHKVISGQVSIHQKYGQTFQRFGLTSIIIHTVDPANIRTVWATNFSDWGIEFPRFTVQGDFAGRGVVTVDGPLWEKSRAVLDPHFHGPTAHRVVFHVMEKYFVKYLKGIPDDGQIIDLQPLIYSLVLEAGYEFLMGEPYTKLPGYDSTSIETVLDWLEYGELGARRRFLQGPMKYLKKDEKWIHACKSVKKLAENMIQRGRAIQKEQEKQPMAEQKQRTLMDRFIEGFEDPIELRSIVIQFLMGTAANQTGRLTYICHQLSNNPTVWNRLREDVKIQGQGELNAKTLRQMHYISKTFDEGLRLYRLILAEFRTARKDTILPKGGGPDGLSPIYAPKGTMVAAGVFALHRNPEVFGPDVDLFNPDRWDDVHPKRFEYMPFGGGPRICPGRDIAKTEAMYFLYRMAQEFETIKGFGEASGSEDGKLVCKVVVTRKGT